MGARHLSAARNTISSRATTPAALTLHLPSSRNTSCAIQICVVVKNFGHQPYALATLQQADCRRLRKECKALCRAPPRATTSAVRYLRSQCKKPSILSLLLHRITRKPLLNIHGLRVYAWLTTMSYEGQQCLVQTHEPSGSLTRISVPAL